MKINIGAGAKKYDGFLNCDHSDLFKPDFIFDLEKDAWPFEDNSVDEVIAFHILEHLGDGYLHAIKELYRVCKDGAIINIKVPHYRHHTMLHDPTHRRCITEYGLKLFDQEFNRNDVNASTKLGLQLNVNFTLMKSEHTLCPYNPMHDRLINKDAKFLYEYSYDKVNVFIESTFILKVKK